MKFGLPENIVLQIQKVFESISKIDKVIIFGSRAKGNYKPGSDIDLAVKGRFIIFDDILSLSSKLDELNLPYKIDLINYSAIRNEDVIEHIDRVGTVFYERWKKYKFSDFIEINPAVKFDNKKKVSFIEMKDLQNGFRNCYPSIERELAGGARFENNDTLFARITPCLENGKICQAKGLKDGVGLGSTEFLVFRGRKDVSDSDFVFYLSRWDGVRDYAENHFEGTSGRQRVPRDCFNSLFLNLPSFDEQVSIASTLSCLDDKIDLFQRQNKTLEQLAETLFRQWFVEEASEDWEVRKVRDFACINKSSISKDYEYEYIEYLDTGSITEGVISEFQVFKLLDAPSRAQRIVRKNDLVYSLVRPIQRHYGILIEVKPNTVVSTGFCVINCHSISPFFMYLLLTIDDSVDYFDMVAEGSTSAYPALKPSDIANFEFALPPKEKLHAFSEYTADAWNKISSNRIQIHTLTKLRDTLLPKLMSGEVRIKR